MLSAWGMTATAADTRHDSQWEPVWITSHVSDAVPYFSHTFSAGKKIRRATLTASALGVMSVRLNGQSVSDTRLEPGESQWNRTVLYCTYDVTHLLREGDNKLTAKVAGGLFHITPVDGRYTKPEIRNNGTTAFACQLDIEYKDGTRQKVSSGPEWLTAASPTTSSNWWGGEDYDARREPTRDDWKNAITITPSINLPVELNQQRTIGRMREQEHEAVRVVETWQAKDVKALPNGDYVVDFGQNFAGVFEFTLTGKKGQRLRMQTSEQLNADGTVNEQEYYAGRLVIYDTYTFGDDGQATWSPEFLYHGFRYLQVSGLTEAPTTDNFKAMRMRVGCGANSRFTTSNELINGIHRICRNSIESQMMHVFTDCPQREKIGWLDVPNQMYNSIALNFDFRQLCHKITRDCFDAQADYEGALKGKVPSTVPHFFTDWDNDPNWGGSAILVPYRTWKTYGDRSLIDEYYNQMRELAAYYTRLSTPDTLMPGARYSRLSDWGQESSGLRHSTAPEFTISCTYYYILKVMEEMATATGHATDANTYRQRAAQVREVFNRRYYDKATASYAHGNQAELAMPLYYGLTEDSQRQRVADRLADKVTEDEYKVKTGECGLKPVLMTLATYGHNDIVWKMACQRDYPSFGYFVENGCTTTPELWNMRYSQNHCMLDHIEEWFYTHLAGIQNDGTAYDKITLKPYVPEDLDMMSASVETEKGMVESSYQRDKDGKVRFQFTVPKGATATIVLPDGTTRNVGAGRHKMQMR